MEKSLPGGAGSDEPGDVNRQKAEPPDLLTSET